MTDKAIGEGLLKLHVVHLDLSSLKSSPIASSTLVSDDSLFTTHHSIVKIIAWDWRLALAHIKCLGRTKSGKILASYPAPVTEDA